MRLLTSKAEKQMQDWYYSKGYDAGVSLGWKRGMLQGEINASNRWIIEGYEPPGSTLQDIERFLREVR